ncbi:MAG: amino acid permease, partial [Erythrobacter sp.]|nr:amino acid permease [Erythrobacter sp.]
GVGGGGGDGFGGLVGTAPGQRQPHDRCGDRQTEPAGEGHDLQCIRYAPGGSATITPGGSAMITPGSSAPNHQGGSSLNAQRGQPRVHPTSTHVCDGAPVTSTLARRLGLTDAVVVGLGAMIGAGVFVAFAPAAARAGSLVWVSLVVAAVVAVCNALSSARLAAQFPSAGGTYVYGRELLGPLPGFLAGWGFVVGKTASCAAMALTVGLYIWPEHTSLVAAASVLALTLLSVLGVQRTATASKVLVGIVLAVAGVYVFIKFSLIAPVIAIEGVRNPITALARSWRLTKGNSLRIFTFFILLFLTIGIIAALVTGIFAVVFSAFDSQVASIGNGLVSAVINSGLTVLFLVVVAAIHRQLAGQSPEGLAATFE